MLQALLLVCGRMLKVLLLHANSSVYFAYREHGRRAFKGHMYFAYREHGRRAFKGYMYFAYREHGRRAFKGCESHTAATGINHYV